MIKYQCYDFLNDPDLECPTVVEESDPEFAAETFAEMLYNDDGFDCREFEVVVIGDRKWRFVVGVDFHPVFSANEVKDV